MKARTFLHFLIFLLIMFTVVQSLQPIEADSSLEASFTFAPTNPYVNGTVTFNASASTPGGVNDTIVSYAWNFSDGSPIVNETAPVTTHVYEAAGIYTVTLNVTDNNGFWNTTSNLVTISPVYGPTANFTYSPSEPFVNGTTTFDASTSTLGWNGTTNPPIVEYKWDFGDNTTGTGNITNHIYQAEGNYTVTLNVTDTTNQWNTTLQTVRVHMAELNLTLITDQPEYNIELDQIQIQGNITFDGNPVPDGLIALEVRSPQKSIIIRTLQTGTASISGAAINITHLFLSDDMGNPIPNNSVNKESYNTYFNVTIKNIGNEILSPVITLNIYQNLYAFYATWASYSPLYPSDRISMVIPWQIASSGIEVGNATVYANVFSNHPHLGGYPHCLEESSTFKVVGSTPEIPTYEVIQPTTNGTYSFTFQIPLSPSAGRGDIQGNYTAYVSTRYESQQATNNTTFTVKLPGDVDSDGRVVSLDFFLLVDAFGAELGDPHWNPNCDFDNSGRVVSYDFFILVQFFGRRG